MAAFKERGANVLVGTPGRLHDVFERSDVLDARRLEVSIFEVLAPLVVPLSSNPPPIRLLSVLTGRGGLRWVSEVHPELFLKT